MRSPEDIHEASTRDAHAGFDRYLGLVHAAATRLSPWPYGHADRDELVSAGMTGLLEAARRYEPGHKAAFSTFAYYRVLGAMRDELRARAARHKDTATTADGLDALPTPLPGPHELLAAGDVLTALTRALRQLPDRERVLIERCFFDGETIAVAATELGLSISRASRVRARAIAALRAAVKAALADESSDAG